MNSLHKDWKVGDTITICADSCRDVPGCGFDPFLAIVGINYPSNKYPTPRFILTNTALDEREIRAMIVREFAVPEVGHANS